MFNKFLNELSDTMLERYGDIEDVKQSFEELSICVETDPTRFVIELKEYIKNKLTIVN